MRPDIVEPNTTRLPACGICIDKKLIILDVNAHVPRCSGNNFHRTIDASRI